MNDNAEARQFKVDAETLATLAALKDRYGVKTNGDVLRRALADARERLANMP